MILITGISGSRKTPTAVKLGEALNRPVFHTDDVYLAIAKEVGIEPEKFIEPRFWRHFPEIHNLKLKHYPKYPKDAIVEGCGVTHDPIFFPGKHTIFVMQPSYLDWLKRFSETHVAQLTDTPETQRIYQQQTRYYRQLPWEYYLVDETIDLLNQLNFPIMYWNQAPEFVKNKYDALKLGDLSELSVIDLGGNNGEIIGLCLANHAKSGLVVDNNWQRLNRARDYQRLLFNCEYLERFTQSADVVLSLSMIHYIKDKDKFVREARRIAKKVFVLETPIDGSRTDAIVPSEEQILSLMYKYFNDVEVVGPSVSPDSSHRKVFKGYI